MSENTWPNPDRPGVPLNPEKDGWHWLEDTVDGVGTGHIEAVYYAAWDVPIWYRAGNKSPITKPKQWRYLGPVLTPDEASALQKRCEEAERERDALRRDTSQQVTTDEMVRRLQHLGDWQAADRIEALQARADRNAAGFARVDAEAERAKFLHKQEIAAKDARIAELEALLKRADDIANWTGEDLICAGRSYASVVKAYKNDRAALGGKDE